jgi:hypothetical protein
MKTTKLLSAIAITVPVLGIVPVSTAGAQTITPVEAAKPTLRFMMRLYTPLELPTMVTDGLIVFHPRENAKGYIQGPNIKGEMVSPTGDWVRVLPGGNMRIDVRAMIKLDDGTPATIAYNGVLVKPSAESWERFMQGKKIEAPEWHYVVAPTFETNSKKYVWLNNVQAVGKFVSIQTGPEAHVAFDLYEVL